MGRGGDPCAGGPLAQPILLQPWPALCRSEVRRSLARVWVLPSTWQRDRGSDECPWLLVLKVLAFFRFFVLLLAYAIVRLRHWWVIAVRRQLLLSCSELSLSTRRLQGSEVCTFVSQVTTLVSSAFLIVKVILSEVGLLGLPGNCCRCFPVAANSLWFLLSSTQLLAKGAFGYLLPIVSFVIAWLETWFLDFKVLTQEAEEERCEYFALLW